jgi:DNA-binding SARP family transcriptional activator
MKRIRGLLYAAVIVSTPFALIRLAGQLKAPHFNIRAIREALSQTHPSNESIVQGFAFVAWALWIFVIAVMILRTLGTVLVRRNVRWGQAFLSLTDALAPLFIRKFVDTAIAAIFFSSWISLTVATPGVAASPKVVLTSQHSAVSRESAVTLKPLTSEQKTYVVKGGDCLWKIAAQELGDPYRLWEIWHLNMGRIFPDGRTFTDPNRIHPGWNLHIPEQIQATQDGSTPPQTDSAGITQPVPVAEPESHPVVSTPSDARATLRIEGTNTSIIDSEEYEERFQSPVVVLSSGSALAAAFASGILTCHLLYKLRRRRSRPISDKSLNGRTENDPRLVIDLRRAVTSPNASQLESAIEEVASAYLQQTGVWPRIVAAIERETGMSFFLEDAKKVKDDSALVSFRSMERGIVRADAKGPLATRLKRRDPKENGLMIPIGADKEGNVIHAGTLAIGSFAVAGENAAAFAAQTVATCCTGCPDGYLDIYLLGDFASLGRIKEIPHIKGSALWEDADVLQEIEAELLRRRRILAEEDPPDPWSYLVTGVEEWLPPIFVVATEPPLAQIAVIESIADKVAQLGGAFMAVGWRPSSSRLDMQVSSTISLSSSLAGLPDTLWPLLLDEAELSQVVDLIEASRKQEYEDPPRPRISPALDEMHEVSGNGSGKLNTSLDSLDSESETDRSSSDLTEEILDAESKSDRIVIDEVTSDDESEILTVRCLGPLAVSRGGRDIGKWRDSTRQLLAYLVAHPHGVSKDRLIDDLLPRLDFAKADADLTRMVFYLRRKIADRHSKYVVRDGGTIRLDLTNLWTDVGTFNSLIAAAEGTDRHNAISLLQQALDPSLYRGEFCEDRYYDWLESVRLEYREKFLLGSMKLATLLGESDQFQDALSVLNRAITIDPTREDVYSKAITLAGDFGEVSVAQRYFQNLKTVLSEQLDVDPSSEIEQLILEVSKSGQPPQL